MKFIPYHRDDLKVFKAIEYCHVANRWKVLDTATGVYQLFKKHGMLNYTKSDLVFANLNTIAILGEASLADHLYIKQQIAAISVFGDDALQRIATNIVDYQQLLDIEPHGMTLELRRSILAFATVFDTVEVG